MKPNKLGRRCLCGKINFLTKEDAQKEIDKQFDEYDAEYKMYQCFEHGKERPVWHLTSANQIKATQLILGNCTKNNTLIIICQTGIQYLVITPGRYLPKQVLSLYDLLGKMFNSTTNDTPIYPIAKKLPGKDQWECADPWVALEIPKHKHREFKIVNEVFTRTRTLDTSKKAKDVIHYLEDALSFLYKSTFDEKVNGIVRTLLELTDKQVIRTEEITVEEPVKEMVVKEKHVTIIKERKFITLYEEGIKAWNSINEHLGPDKNISEVIEQLLIEYARTK